MPPVARPSTPSRPSLRRSLADYQRAGKIPITCRRNAAAAAAAIANWLIGPGSRTTRWPTRRTPPNPGVMPPAPLRHSRRADRGDRGAPERTSRAITKRSALEKLGDDTESPRALRRARQSGRTHWRRRRLQNRLLRSFGKQQSQRSQLARAHYIAGLAALVGRNRRGQEEFQARAGSQPGSPWRAPSPGRIGRNEKPQVVMSIKPREALPRAQ